MRTVLQLILREPVRSALTSAPPGLQAALSALTGKPSPATVSQEVSDDQVDDILSWAKGEWQGATRAQRIDLTRTMSEQDLATYPFIVLDLVRTSVAKVKKLTTTFRSEPQCAACGRLRWHQGGALEVTGKLSAAVVFSEANVLLARTDLLPALHRHGVSTSPLLNRTDYIQVHANGEFEEISDGRHQVGRSPCPQCGIPREFGNTDFVDGELPMTATSRVAIFEQGWVEQGRLLSGSGPVLCAPHRIGRLPPADEGGYAIDQLYSQYAVSASVFRDLERLLREDVGASFRPLQLTR